MGVVVEVDGARLQWRRKGQDLTMEELGKTAGISPSTIWRLEKGRGPAWVTTVRKLAEALGVDAVDLLVMKEPIGKKESHISYYRCQVSKKNAFQWQPSFREDFLSASRE
jgi:transcriptional regulator with XRE-family HTH domain